MASEPEKKTQNESHKSAKLSDQTYIEEINLGMELHGIAAVLHLTIA